MLKLSVKSCRHSIGHCRDFSCWIRLFFNWLCLFGFFTTLRKHSSYFLFRKICTAYLKVSRFGPNSESGAKIEKSVKRNAYMGHSSSWAENLADFEDGNLAQIRPFCQNQTLIFALNMTEKWLKTVAFFILRFCKCPIFTFRRLVFWVNFWDF